MTATPAALPWLEPDWIDRVTRWVDRALADADRARTGPLVVVHQRPWSFFAHVPTTRGNAYFKAPAPATWFEAGLTRALASWCPTDTVPLLAVDETNGWMLSAHAGVTLRHAVRQQGRDAAWQIERWVELLPRVARMQQELAPRLPDLLALDVPDRRLTRLPTLFSALLDDEDALLLGRDNGLTPEQHRQLRAGLPRFARRCRELAALGLPDTLTHEEIHENNVLFTETPPEDNAPNAFHFTLTDWSDCSVSHPFFTMLVTIRATAHWLGLDEASPAIERLRHAYLAPWRSFAPAPALHRGLLQAYHLGMVLRALSWHLGTSQLPAEHTADYADAVPGWLQDYLAADAAD